MIKYVFSTYIAKLFWLAEGSRQNFRLSCIIQSKEGVGGDAVFLLTYELRFSSVEDVGNIAKFSRLKTHQKYIFLPLNFQPLHILPWLLFFPRSYWEAFSISRHRTSQTALRACLSAAGTKRALC
jgi:hypothetical protein